MVNFEAEIMVHMENRNSGIMAPLSERMRPTSLDGYVGQEHLAGKDGVLR